MAYTIPCPPYTYKPNKLIKVPKGFRFDGISHIPETMWHDWLYLHPPTRKATFSGKTQDDYLRQDRIKRRTKQEDYL